MEYLGILPLGIVVAAVGLRFYVSLKDKATAQAETAGLPLSPRARRVQEATIARRLLRYHRGLAHA